MIKNWSAMPKRISLQQHEIHLIRVHTPTVMNSYDAFWQILSPDEQARAARFHFDKDRHQSVCARAILRLILANLLNISASEITFEVCQHGKLSLPANLNDIALEFNLSHSHEVIVYALTTTVPIGVDVEYPKTNIDYDGIATRFFSEQEQKQLLSLAPEQKAIGFYNAWTRKEAYIKAIGEGLSHPLDTFDVTLLPNEPAHLTRLANNPELLSQWTMAEFTPYSGYFAAYATQQLVEKVHYWDWR